MVLGSVEDSNVAQHTTGDEQAVLFVKNTANVFVRRNKTLHQDVALAIVNHFNGFGYAINVLFDVDNLEFCGVDTVLSAHCVDNIFVTNQNTLDETEFYCIVYSLNSVSILGISCHKATFRAAFRSLDNLFQMFNHCLL